MRKQKIETYLVPRLGPRTSAPASAPVLGPSLGTKWVSIFLIFALHETTQGFKFSCKNMRETTKKFQKKYETGPKKKKKSGFYLKPAKRKENPSFPIKIDHTKKKYFYLKLRRFLTLLLFSFIKKFTLVHLNLWKNTSIHCFWKNQGLKLFSLYFLLIFGIQCSSVLI